MSKRMSYANISKLLGKLLVLEWLKINKLIKELESAMSDTPIKMV